MNMLSSTSLSSPFLPGPKLNLSQNSRSIRFNPPRAAAATASRSTSNQEHRSRYLSPQRSTESRISLYEILGIPIGASNQEIKTAYRRLARICHPDVAPAPVNRDQPSDFIKLHEAYSTLSDPEKRADYDGKNLLRRNRPLTSASSGFSCYRGRNWESDQCW